MVRLARSGARGACLVRVEDDAAVPQVLLCPMATRPVNEVGHPLPCSSDVALQWGMSLHTPAGHPCALRWCKG